MCQVVDAGCASHPTFGPTSPLMNQTAWNQESMAVVEKRWTSRGHEQGGDSKDCGWIDLWTISLEDNSCLDPENKLERDHVHSAGWRDRKRLTTRFTIINKVTVHESITSSCTGGERRQIQLRRSQQPPSVTPRNVKQQRIST